MKLSTRGRYATMAMVDMAQQHQEGRSEAIRLGEIAARQEIPLTYLEQIFVRLRRAGLVKSRRGAHGGYRLAGQPSSISVADIIVASEEGFTMTRCASKAGCLHTGRCRTHALWAALGRQIYDFCSEISLDDVLQGDARALLGRAPQKEKKKKAERQRKQ